jgi:hypothetical protein
MGSLEMGNLLHFFSGLRGRSPIAIDQRISYEMGCHSMARFRVHTKELPSYRFVDLSRAIEAYCGARQVVHTIESGMGQGWGQALIS